MTEKQDLKHTVSITLNDVVQDGKNTVSIEVNVDPKVEKEEDITGSVMLGIEIMEYLKMREQMGPMNQDDQGIVAPDPNKKIIMPE